MNRFNQTYIRITGKVKNQQQFGLTHFDNHSRLTKIKIKSGARNHSKNGATLKSQMSRKDKRIKMKKYLVSILFVLVTTLAFAQSNYQDVVYLKNGNIIRGIIIEQVPNKSIKIETADRSVFLYQMDEIEKLTKEEIKGKSKNTGDLSGLKTGYKGIAEMGYQIGVGNYGMDRLKLNVIYGYQISPYFSLGLGTGLRYYFDAGATLIPVFADFRANFLNKRVSPYLSLGLGYSFDAGYHFKGVGFLLNPTAGVSFKVSNKSSLNVGLGYEMQTMDFYGTNYYGYYSNSQNSGAISIIAGVSF